ncbi:MAG: 23S rRNA (uracil(1939)-C(5))-methyltransferase RlmD [Anaerolineae bacterium]|nr:23S rRNA (uracil(1939)-C(5))-methyltransferase RlmD [Anaerolineae bacterium]
MADKKTIRVTIESMANGGSGIAKHNGQVIFIPYTIPGEVLDAQIIREKGRVAFGRGVTLQDASADRVYPKCAHFGAGKCGRCQWQHIDYQAQLLLKQDVLADQFERVGGFANADIQPVIQSPIEWGYLYQLAFEISPEGQIGLPSADDDTLTVITTCEILHPDLLELYESLEMDFVGMRRLKLRLGSDNTPMLILYVEDEADLPELAVDFPASVNAILPDGVPINLIGETHSRYTINGHEFRVTAGCDFRHNIAQIGELSALVTKILNITPDDVVGDFYGGCGFLSVGIAPHAKSVTLVESYPPAVHDARQNCKKFDNIQVIDGAVEDELYRLNDFDALILDPPSDGLSLAVVDALGESSVKRIAYISSDPATLARDCKRLVSKGYRLGKVYPIDMHPQTYYIDAVAVLERG